MPAAAKKNAIERRLDDLTGHWNEFVANSKARLLRWLADADNAGVVDTYIETQRQGGGDVPDLFIRFETPFVDPPRYGLALREELRAQFTESRDEMNQSGIDTEWISPNLIPAESDVKSFVRVCESLADHYKSLLENLVIVLTPKGTVDPAAWNKWLLSMVRSELPANIRIMVLDQAETPILDELVKAEAERVVTVPVDLDMPAAYAELARDVKGHGPGVDFRKLFVALTNAAGKKDVATAQQAATAALAIATKENWPNLQVAVHMALGAAFISAGKAIEALPSYQCAGKAAEAAIKAGDPAGGKLLLPPRFAEGAALITAGRYADAAKVFEATAPIASEQNDDLMTLEAWRMAAYCHESDNKPPTAWECGQKALAAGAVLAPEQRANSMLPFVGQMLLRLTTQQPFRDQADGIRRKMVELVGADWEKRTQL